MNYARDLSLEASDLDMDGLSSLPSLCPEIMALARRRVDALAKPPGSLGRLEEMAVQLAAIQNSERITLDKARLFTLAGDHGVTAEGVNSTPVEVTRIQMANFLNGGGGISAMCKTSGMEHYVVDVGAAGDDFAPHPHLIRHKIRPGTGNIACGPAMTMAECREAIAVGVALARLAARDGCRAVGTGEMGIGNTTPSAALFCALLGFSPEQAVGPGAGVPAIGLDGKIAVIRRALAANAADAASGDPLRILSALGGFEIAAMAGLMLGAAKARMAVILDGFIATAAFAAASAIAPTLGQYCFLGHCSAETAHREAARRLGLSPLLDLGLCLGEGSGAALAYCVLKASANMYTDMRTLAELGIHV